MVTWGTGRDLLPHFECVYDKTIGNLPHQAPFCTRNYLVVDDQSYYSIDEVLAQVGFGPGRERFTGGGSRHAAACFTRRLVLQYHRTVNKQELLCLPAE